MLEASRSDREILGVRAIVNLIPLLDQRRAIYTDKIEAITKNRD